MNVLLGNTVSASGAVRSSAPRRSAARASALAGQRAAHSGSSLSSRQSLAGARVSSAPRLALSGGRPASVSPSALFKQSKESVQWTTVLFAFVGIAVVFVPLVRGTAGRILHASPSLRVQLVRLTPCPARAQFLLSRPSLMLVAAAVLAVVTLTLLVELVGDAIRRRHLDVSGEKAAWLAKSQAVADAALKKQAAARTAETIKATSWAERNVAGAKDEEDARLIRETNQFLQ